MNLIEISHLFKTYKVGKKYVNVLNDISVSFPELGLVTILGKSGSGKSTLLNIIGGIDKASSGSLVFSYSRNKESSPTFIFQHYLLLENETPLFNVMLPGLIQGYEKSFCEKQAKELLKLFDIDESLFYKQTRFLSGGEKERIAILRALITDPRLILADEPTGALDLDNAIKTMEILKNASKKRLVILVTHNRKLAEKYSNRIIELSGGKIISDREIEKVDGEVHHQKIKNKFKNDWASRIIDHNFKKRIRRNLISTLGMTISLTFCYLLFGFSNQSLKAINEVSCKHFDYGTSVISKEIKTDSNSTLSLLRTLRPDDSDVDDIKSKFPYFEILPNYDAVFNSGELHLDNDNCESISNAFVYSYTSDCFDKNLFNLKIPSYRKWNDVVVNQKALNIIKSSIVHYKINYENKFITKDCEIIDYFDIDERLNIIGVVEEFDFLSTPKIYFDYLLISDLFANSIMENYSDLENDKISWNDYIVSQPSNSDITSFSLKCFLKTIDDKKQIEKLSEYLTEEIKLENDSLTIKEALVSLTTAASVGLDIFLVIAILGSVLILGVFSYSAYNDDKKESSILSCLGAKDFEVVGIYASESLIVTFLSFIFSTVVSWVLQKPLNLLLDSLIDIPNLISIPFSSYLGFKYLLPLLILILSLLVTFIFSSTSIFINKKISLKKELSDL